MQMRNHRLAATCAIWVLLTAALFSQSRCPSVADSAITVTSPAAFAPMKITAPASAAPITITIDIPEKVVEGKPEGRTLRNDTIDEYFSVTLKNVSLAPISLVGGYEKNSLENLSFEIDRGNGTVDMVHQTRHPLSAAVKGEPSIKKLAPGDTFTMEIYYCRDSEWDSFGFPPVGERKVVTMRAILDDHVRTAPGFAGGKVESDPVAVTLVGVTTLGLDFRPMTEKL
jgi:hypothetical protein